MWRMNKKDRCFRTILLFINCITCVAVVYLYVTYGGNQESLNEFLPENFLKPEKLIGENCTPVCDSRDCVGHANMFLKNMDSTIDPCEDLLSFMCGRFREKIGPGEKGNVIEETDSFLLNKLKGILENIQAKPESASAKMKIVYDSCVNYGSSELQGLKELENFLKIMGISNWPNHSRDFTFGGIDLPIILGHFIAFNAENMFHVMHRYKEDDSCEEDDRCKEDEINVKESHMSVRFNDIELFKSYFSIPHEVATGILKYFDLETKDRDSIIEDHNFVKNSIIKLFNESASEERYIEICPEHRCSSAYISCPRQKEDAWHDFCETVNIIVNLTNIGQPTNTSVVEVSNFERIFFQELFPLLKGIPKRTFANFLALSFIKGYYTEIKFYYRLQNLKDFGHEFGYEILNKKKYYGIDRWKYCIRWIAEKMQVPLVNEFYHQYLSSSITEELIDIYKNYSSEIMDLVNLQEWIPTDLKSRIINRMKKASFNLDTMSQHYPNDSYVDKSYEKFLPSKDSFLYNTIQLKILNTFIEPSILSVMDIISRKRTRFEVQAAAGSSLVIHFGMLLPPFYVPGYNRLMNRVMLSPVMVHELGHFVYIVLDGKLEDNNIFLEKRQCLWDQFSKFKFDNLNENLKGSHYDFENFPDTVVTLIIDKEIERQSSMQISLPGLPYSLKQLLYMTSVQTSCAKSNLERDLFYTKDQHAPLEFRLQAKMQNSRGFSEAFQCPDGSYMNPETKCLLFDPK